MSELNVLIGRLCRISASEADGTRAGIEWPERIGANEWCMSPELLSLYGTPFHDALSDDERRRLSLAEAVNFFSLNIHGERLLIAGIARRLYQNGHDGISPYLHHFLEEENRHIVMFAGFCQRYAGRIYPDRKLAVPRAHAPGEEDFLFFAKVLVFEEIVDQYNQIMAGDRRLAPVVRHINRTHHRDEARHLAFGRSLAAQLFEQHAPRWSGEELGRVRAELAAYFTAAWKEYYSPDAYRDAGVPAPFETYRQAYDDPRCRAHRTEISRGVIAHLRSHGILDEEPPL